MKKILSYVAIFIATINCYAQITFEKGYFISNEGEKVECLIKNIDWKDTPTEFIYKRSAIDSEKTNTINSIKEFGIYNSSKYIRANIDIDKSSSIVGELSNNRNPVFIRETLFLKVLIEGDASLFSYKNSNLKRFFFSTNEREVTQLIYKKYTNNYTIYENKQFLQQLFNNLKCHTLTTKRIEALKYNDSSLSNFFIDYNECKNSESINFYRNSKKRKAFSLAIKAGVNNNSLSIKNSTDNSRNTDFGNKISGRFGIEAEYIFPFNKNKWSLVIAPAYQSFKSQKSTESNNVSGNTLVSSINYSSIEVPIGVKHSFFLNKNSKIYLLGSYVVTDIKIDSAVDFNRGDGSNLSSLNIKPNSSFAVTLGYKYDKYSIDLRYNSKDLLGNYSFWSSDYKSLSLNIGYTIF
ncbi:tRNA modification GTPase [Tenacibaculum sp. FZY0031]|uniref:tRNA modification GTPase n=1 Tax=Tenacibaculum sp. FZY0031 TaxID=3116648 RepID=UPI002EAFA534|nr:tRNA modification GTPase [Tenacibaculum sp. FZY0031]